MLKEENSISEEGNELVEQFESGVAGDAEELKAEPFDSEETEPAEDQDEETVTDDELDQIADTALEVIRSLLQYFDALDAEIDEYEGEEGELIFDIVNTDLSVLIGRYGRNLEAFQNIVSSIVTKKVGYHYPVTVDIEGYKQRRREKIESIAKASAARAIRQGNPVSLRPMSPYERRIVHVVLKADKRIETYSEGEGPNRYVVIDPK